jgi:acetyl-CoA C-acetyltransferase
MSFPAAKGTCTPRAGIAVRCLPVDPLGPLRRDVAAVESVPEVGRVPHSFTHVNSIGYEDHGFAEWFGGYLFADAEVTSVRGAALVSSARELKVEGGAAGANDVAQCPELFTHRLMAVSPVPAARIAMAHNVEGLTVLSAGTIPEGPRANGS